MSIRVPDPVGPVDGTVVPRFAGESTFARIPRIDAVSDYDIAVLGVPFDGGTSYRPGARFGPLQVRTSSRHLRPAFHVELDVAPFGALQVVDAGDVACTPFSITDAMSQVEKVARDVRGDAPERRLISIGGDHTIAYPLIKSAVAQHGPVALVHFDAHLDTWDTYFSTPLTHGTVFRRCFEEGLLAEDKSIHVGIRGPIYDRIDLRQDRDFGFRAIRCSDLDRIGIDEAVAQVKERVGDTPVYLSLDIDVLDPAFAPGTGTPESGGLSSRELLALLRRLDGLNLVGADVVEVAPAYDHAEVTTVAAATVVYDIIALMTNQALGRTAG
ncbi:agmatinase [Brachybacterium squillarum]|uniref:agmatinase n=1 Tax=Brachybacterium squillarum TaxID=661979 RepID=UPI0022217BF1|nr:agmatinase [Brachybacterium squillarum]MCW1805642.1 agmatinase [Brachybacterium squillarum]